MNVLIQCYKQTEPNVNFLNFDSVQGIKFQIFDATFSSKSNI